MFSKIVYNSLCITVATLLTEDKQFDFEENYNICLKAEFVFILMLITRLLFFFFFKQVNTVTDISYVPGSLRDMFEDQTVPMWLTYIFDTINIWEIFFCILGAALFKKFYRTTLDQSIKLFVFPYALGLIILMALNAFFAVQLNP